MLAVLLHHRWRVRNGIVQCLAEQDLQVSLAVATDSLVDLCPELQALRFLSNHKYLLLLWKAPSGGQDPYYEADIAKSLNCSIYENWSCEWACEENAACAVQASFFICITSAPT